MGICSWKKLLGASEDLGDNGIYFQTAEKIRKSLRETLAKGKWIATNQQVRFPSLEQIRKLPSPAPGQERLEWLEDKPPEGDMAVLAKVNSWGAEPIRAFRNLERCGFRLVILYPAPDSRRDAWDAAKPEVLVE